MNCPKCGTSLPDNARFCFACGNATVAMASPPPPPAAPTPPSSSGGSGAPESLNCPKCGAPLHPVFGEMVISCDYCGASVTLGGAGWKQISKHSMLAPKVTSADQALAIVHPYLDVGFMHRNAFEESKIVEQKLSFVPFWVVPVSATTNYVYTDVAVAAGGTAASVGAAVLLGSALGGRRGGFTPIPIFMGSPVNSSRQDTIVGTYDYPVVAVMGMSAYQPKNYEFGLTERSFFDKKMVPAGAPILNGDLGEEAAQHSARSFVTQLQAEEAHKRHRMVSQLSCQCEVSEAELLHVPIWYFLLDRKGAKAMILVDAHGGRVIQTVG
ncbi:MAG: zinc ribbon domain-containing protein [Thermoplasmata archaeon]|nr:zinc ribbon domain-containing protein [Thermoplasmata archaeon]